MNPQVTVIMGPSSCPRDLKNTSENHQASILAPGNDRLHHQRYRLDTYTFGYRGQCDNNSPTCLVCTSSVAWEIARSLLSQLMAQTRGLWERFSAFSRTPAPRNSIRPFWQQSVHVILELRLCDLFARSRVLSGGDHMAQHDIEDDAHLGFMGRMRISKVLQYMSFAAATSSAGAQPLRDELHWRNVESVRKQQQSKQSAVSLWTQDFSVDPPRVVSRKKTQKGQEELGRQTGLDARNTFSCQSVRPPFAVLPNQEGGRNSGPLWLQGPPVNLFYESRENLTSMHACWAKFPVRLLTHTRLDAQARKNSRRLEWCLSQRIHKECVWGGFGFPVFPDKSAPDPPKSSKQPQAS